VAIIIWRNDFWREYKVKMCKVSLIIQGKNERNPIVNSYMGKTPSGLRID